mmetsp:Transcript_76352/g.221694  ORF Transcript_76352/g.221694 Transcript_76352/m.221694 type:complete len:369 (-) Transcript_76352:1734-2840(-)
MKYAHTLAAVDDRHRAVSRQAHRKYADVQFLRSEAEQRLGRLPCAAQHLVFAVVGLKGEKAFHELTAGRRGEDHLRGQGFPWANDVLLRVNGERGIGANPREAGGGIAWIRKHQRLANLALQIVLLKTEVQLRPGHLDDNWRNLCLHEQLESMHTIDRVDDLALEALRYRGADCHVEARSLRRGYHLRNRAGAVQLFRVILHGKQDGLRQVVEHRERLDHLRPHIDIAEIKHTRADGDQRKLPVLQGGGTVPDFRLSCRPCLELFLDKLGLVVLVSLTGDSSCTAVVVQRSLQMKLLRLDLVHSIPWTFQPGPWLHAHVHIVLEEDVHWRWRLSSPLLHYLPLHPGLFQVRVVSLLVADMRLHRRRRQ